MPPAFFFDISFRTPANGDPTAQPTVPEPVQPPAPTLPAEIRPAWRSIPKKKGPSRTSKRRTEAPILPPAVVSPPPQPAAQTMPFVYPPMPALPTMPTLTPMATMQPMLAPSPSPPRAVDRATVADSWGTWGRKYLFIGFSCDRHSPLPCDCSEVGAWTFSSTKNSLI